MMVTYATPAHRMAKQLRDMTGLEILPKDVQKVVYEWVCPGCNEKQWSIHVQADGSLTRVHGIIPCKTCGRTHSVPE